MISSSTWVVGFSTYVRVDLLEELHFFDHGLDLALKVNANKGSIVAIFAHLGQVSLKVFALGLNQNLFHVGFSILF